jgi:hypothetical protein
MVSIADHKESLASQIKDVLRHREYCELDELTSAFPNRTWCQIFFEVDRMSRSGELLLRRREPGRYFVSLPLYSKAAKPEEPHGIAKQ